MNFRTCYRCSLRRVDGKRCARLQAFAGAIKGLSILSVEFACPDRDALFQPGEAVSFEVYEDRHCEDPVLTRLEGWVMCQRGRKWRVVCPDAEKPILHFYSASLTKLDAPRKRICIHCAMPEGIEIKLKRKGYDEAEPWVCTSTYEDGVYEQLECEYGPAAGQPDAEERGV